MPSISRVLGRVLRTQHNLRNQGFKIVRDAIKLVIGDLWVGNEQAKVIWDEFYGRDPFDSVNEQISLAVDELYEVKGLRIQIPYGASTDSSKSIKVVFIGSEFDVLFDEILQSEGDLMQQPSYLLYDAYVFEDVGAFDPIYAAFVDVAFQMNIQGPNTVYLAIDALHALGWRVVTQSEPSKGIIFVSPAQINALACVNPQYCAPCA